MVTDEPDLERAARELADGFYHENIDPGIGGFWVEAKDLRVGDVFIGANGELSELLAAERVTLPDGVKVFNITVDGNHNYYIIGQTAECGQTSILVHNANCTNGTNLVGHHTIPKQIQKWLALAGNKIANDLSIIGKKGLPNIKKIPEWLHKAIHTGGNGGAYNARFLIELNKVTKNNLSNATVKMVLTIRDSLVKEFGL